MEEKKYEIAKKRVGELKGFYIHIIVYAAVIAILAAINITTMVAAGYMFLWFLFPAGGWAIGLFWHAMAVFVFSRRLGPEWEKKKIKEVMDKIDD